MVLQLIDYHLTFPINKLSPCLSLLEYFKKFLNFLLCMYEKEYTNILIMVDVYKASNICLATKCKCLLNYLSIFVMVLGGHRK